jgi:hypothetical protein
MPFFPGATTHPGRLSGPRVGKLQQTCIRRSVSDSHLCSLLLLLLMMIIVPCLSDNSNDTVSVSARLPTSEALRMPTGAGGMSL